MQLKTGIIKAQPEHIPYIAQHMRQSDKDELWAASHSKPLEALNASFNRSLECWTGIVNGVPICMFGVAPMSISTGVAVPWMLGTEDLEQHALTFLKGSRRVVATWKETYTHLFNHVDVRNETAIRWLDWLGFDIQEAAPHGIEGLPFHRFEFIRKADV